MYGMVKTSVWNEDAKRGTSAETDDPARVLHGDDREADCDELTDTGLGGSSHDAACASLVSARSHTVLAS